MAEKQSHDDEEVATENKKIKLEESKMSEEFKLSQKVANQIDYYFSDVNVVQDKFLLEEFKKDSGWVELSTLLKFSRLKELTDSQERIVQALEECKPKFVSLDESKNKVRRIEPVPDVEEYRKKLALRTVHISGFPTDYTFDTLNQFCKKFGDVESVAMRRHFKTRFFKGCIHVVYKSEEDAKKVLATEPLKCKDRELRKESMEEYHRRKDEMAKKRAEDRKKKGKKEVSNESDLDKKKVSKEEVSEIKSDENSNNGTAKVDGDQ